jgi:hypothetical protein
MFLTQVWRGNVDVKPLLYQSDPSNPYPEDIITCSDYLVGYQIKGAQKIAIERKNINDLVMRMEYKNGDITEVFMLINYSHSRNPPCAPARTHGQIQAPREPPN